MNDFSVKNWNFMFSEIFHVIPIENGIGCRFTKLRAINSFFFSIGNLNIHTVENQWKKPETGI